MALSCNSMRRCLLVVAVAAAWVPPAARRAPFAVRPRTHPLPRHPRAGRPATHARRAVVLRPHEDWATWALLSGAGAFGLWAEERSQLGAALSSNVVTMLAALVNLKLLPSASPVYGVVYYWLVPVAVASLLLDAALAEHAVEVRVEEQRRDGDGDQPVVDDAVDRRRARQQL